MKNRSMKWFRFFETLFYSILLGLPLISVFARVIYTQSNNHSYLSYSDTSSYRSINIDSDNSSLVQVGRNYLYNGFIATPSSASFSIGNVIGFTWSESSYNLNDYFTSVTFPITGLGFDFAGNTNFVNIWFYDSVLDTFVKTFSNQLIIVGSETTNIKFLKSLQFEFTLLSSVASNNPSGITCNFYDSNAILYSVNVFGKLDNALDYGLQKTIDDFGTGNINFLNWFGTMFSNNTNLLYINFVNMYLNYALWVSVGYLIYYFLTFFLKIIRNLIDSFIKKGESW